MFPLESAATGHCSGSELMTGTKCRGRPIPMRPTTLHEDLHDFQTIY